MTVTLNLPMPPPANNLFANGAYKGRYRTKEYNSWIEQAGWELARQRPGKVAGKVSVLIEVEDSDNYRTDADGRAKAPLDLLVRHRVIEDDSKQIVRKVSVEWREDITGARITITPVEG